MFENEARGTGLVKPMLLLPPPLPPDDTVMVTGDEDGDEVLLTIFVQKSTKRMSDLKMKEKSPSRFKWYYWKILDSNKLQGNKELKE